MRRGFAVVAALASVLASAVACSDFGDDIAPTPSPSDSGTSDASDVSLPDSSGPSTDADVADASSPFCGPNGGGANARTCLDFEPTTDPLHQWDAVLDTPETQGNGVPPFVMPSGDPDRKTVYVARFDGDSSVKYATSRRAHHDNSPGWEGGIPPRVYEVKIYIEHAPTSQLVGIFSWEGVDTTGHGLYVSCPNEEATSTCTLTAFRGLDVGIPVENAVIQKRRWTKLTINLPPVVYLNDGNDESPTATITTEPLGGTASAGTVIFTEKAAAPKVFRMDLGIVRPNQVGAPCEVWFDDLSLKY